MSKFQLNPQRLSCLVELGTGTALLLTPGLAMTLIVGSSLPSGGNQMAQLFGAAILCLGLSCWSSSECERTSMPVIGLTAYNVIAGLLLPSSQSPELPTQSWQSPRSAAHRLGVTCSSINAMAGVDRLFYSTVDCAAESHMTSGRIQRLSHQGRRSEAVAIVVSTEK